MQAYREISVGAFRAQLALNELIALETRAENARGRDVAAAYRVARSTLYHHRATALRALLPAPAGPRPPSDAALALRSAQQQSQALRSRISALEATIAELEARRAGSIGFDTHRQHALELVLAVENVSLRGVRRVYEVLADGNVSLRVPRLADVQRRRHEAGLAAGRLLTRARAQVAKSLACVMGDDIFFAGCAVKVVAEPQSVAILNVARWPWHKEEDWTLWLEEFEGLQLFVSDLGSDVCNAAKARDVWHQADWFHEEQWWDERVLTPLARLESAARSARAVAERAQAYVGQEPAQRTVRVCRRGRHKERTPLPFEQRLQRMVHRSVVLARAEHRAAEGAWYAAYEALECIRALYQVADVDGVLWNDGRVAAMNARIEGVLAQIPGEVGARAREHFGRYGSRYASHRRLLLGIPVERTSGATWSVEQILQGVWDVRALEQRASCATGAVFASLEDCALELRERLQQECENLDAVVDAVARHARWVPRSSSAVESLNSQLRVLQMLHRTVSDEMLWLHALAWNLTPRREGKRRGQSPYAMLGVDLGQGNRPFYDVLLREIAAA